MRLAQKPLSESRAPTQDASARRDPAGYTCGMRPLVILIVLVACAAAIGCSSSGEGSVGGGSFDCNSGCDKLASAGCPKSQPKSECVSECEQELNQAGSCASAYNAVVSCAFQQPLTCSPSGEPTIDSNAALSSCLTQSVAYARCGACVEDSGDDDCDRCVKAQCCAERQATFDDPNIGAYTQCFQACNDSQCRTDCVNQYPSILEKAGASAKCQADKCGSAC